MSIYMLFYKKNGCGSAQSNNSFNRSGISLLLIVNLDGRAVDSRPVNSGVGRFVVAKMIELAVPQILIIVADERSFSRSHWL